MATLEIKIYCLCLFVPDPEAKTVHVLMPDTEHGKKGERYGGIGDAGEDDHHLVRVFHRTFGDQKVGRPMEGLTLVVGKDPAKGTADTSLRPRKGRKRCEEVVDLTHVIQRRLDRALVDDPRHPKVAARMILRAGHVKRLDSDVTWELAHRPIDMAFKVVWRIEDVPEDEVFWTPSDAKDPPFRSLKDLGPDGDGVYRFKIAHMTEKGMPPGKKGTLNKDEVRKHFRQFYRLYDFDAPGDHQLPDRPDRADNLNCPTARGTLRP